MLKTKIGLEPMPGKLIVKINEENVLSSGLYLVRNSRQSTGQVVAVYDDFVDPDNDAEVSPFIDLDDFVIFGQHSGVEVTYQREKYVILRESEILCRVVPGEESSAEVGVA